MRTITEIETKELIIKNSRFITILFPITQESNPQELINQTKIKYPKATHYCYAYITENTQKSSDDGEPGGTAGVPMLNILIKENIINVLVIVVRYFGGIKLGAGGLVRAYAKSVKEALSSSTLIPVEKGYKIKISTTYNNQKKLDYILKNYSIISKEYNEIINYKILLPKNKLSILNDFEYTIENELYIKVPSTN